MSAVILPGTAVGVLGSGQLGRMFAIAARRMGYRVHTYSPDADTPTGQVADVEINAPYEDLDQVRAFARGVRVITFEFENVPSATVEAARLEVPVRPGGHVLHTTQQRLREKSFLRGAGFPVTPFAAIRADGDLDAAADAVGVPAILKSAAFGYDGKGQTRVLSRDDLRPAWERLGRQEAILEALVDFSLEVSVVAARGVDGSFAHYGVVENHHVNHVLDVSIAPARIPAAVAREAVELTRAILERLDVVGVLCVEFFVTRASSLLINELAPRPHNSGHFTFDACVTSQFEQQLRAVCGLPLGSTEQLRPAAMANLLGDRWARGEPRWSAACAFPSVKLHLYGKTEPRPGRKMGHLTALAASAEEAQQQVLAARAALEAGLHSPDHAPRSPPAALVAARLRLTAAGQGRHGRALAARGGRGHAPLEHGPAASRRAHAVGRRGAVAGFSHRCPDRALPAAQRSARRRRAAPGHAAGRAAAAGQRGADQPGPGRRDLGRGIALAAASRPARSPRDPRLFAQLGPRSSGRHHRYP